MTDKQALRDIAEKTKIAGEAPVMPFEQRINALNDFMKHFTPATALAMLDELEAKDRRIAKLSTKRARDVETLQSELIQARIRAEDAEKRIAESSGQKRLIGWRASDYTDETSDPELAKNWAAAIGVLPIFEGDVNTKLSAAGIGKGE
ncbi:ead/Ea22-like family protein [Citrobacter koseri]|uniref:ead/Ea22-like family protein n=1 Tax=Citrobacter TaxID=544 RepID=UPI001A313EFA|nr:ead/Ea22-like family protein [Citrobacter freundii]MBE9975559.1 ead/Ea22-like family protein [Citrobacter freundii]MBE9985146.1 ead/Ea22-like family protein [Citrobacter freundii]MBF0064514.1 ead/Ea22-like family protein [Citrobacter freundii]HAT4379516.1 ead/Ea22-like family protein [Citrobacter freundii]